MRTWVAPAAATAGGIGFQLSIYFGWIHSFEWVVPWVWALSLALWCYWLVSHPKIDGRLRAFTFIGRGAHLLEIALCLVVFIFSGRLIQRIAKHPQQPSAVVASATQQQSPNTKPQAKQDQFKNKPSTNNSNSQQSHGDNSPNVATFGNNSPVTINNSDPNVAKRLDEITNLIKEQQGAQLSSNSLLVKYPLGYGIFYADRTDKVFPYDTAHVLDGWNIDWSKLQISRNYVKTGVATISLPNVTVHGMISEENSIDVDMRVGAILNGGAALFDDGTAAMKGEVLAVSDKDIVLLFGFVRSAPGPVLFGRPKPGNKGRYAGEETQTP